jgi:SAM-dependent methyltransferase
MKLSKIAKKLLLLQRNELLSKRQVFYRKKFGRFLFTNFFIHLNQKKNLTDLSFELFEKEYNIIKNYLPNKAKNIMDVGCGLGIINIFLQQHYKNNLKYFLIDKNKIDLKIKYGFKDNYESYNDLQETKKLLNSNGIKNENILMIDAEKQIIIDQKIDFVISLKSMGYHYPYEKYLSLLKKVASDNCIFIFDLASKKYKDLEMIKKHFREYEVIFEEESIHPLKRLVLKGLITNS